MARLLDPHERLGAALGYAALGLHVLPLHHPVFGPDEQRAEGGVRCSCGDHACQQLGDHPIIPGGAGEATGDPDRIRWWWRRFPLANVGLATGQQFDVLDVEGAGGDRLRWSLVVATLRAGGPLVRTGGDGWQFYLAPLGLGDIRPAGLARIGWRGLGGWVAAPPSRHASGAVAAWVRGPDTPLPVVPTALRERLRSSPPSHPNAPGVRLPPSPLRPYVHLPRSSESDVPSFSRRSSPQISPDRQQSAIR